MKARFFKPTKITWIVFTALMIIMMFGASQRVALFDDANDRKLNLIYSSLPDSIQDFPLFDIWVSTIAPIVLVLGVNVWIYGLDPESGSFSKEVFFISFNIAYYYVVSCSVSYVITNRKHDGWKNSKRNNKIILILSALYPCFLLTLGVYGFYFISSDAGYAPNPQESYFFALTVVGSISVMIFFVVMGMIYWANNQKPKRVITAIPFALFLVILFSLLTGILPKGANA